MTAGRAETVFIGRIATLAGDAGFGFVEAIAVRAGRVVAAGRASDVDGLVGPGTRRIELAPDEVAIPGLTDAHLHLADAAIAAGELDLAEAPTAADGLAAIGAAHAGLVDSNAWLLGRGWEADRWGGWPTWSDLERVAPGRRVALWAHDHHSLWVSRAALVAAGIGAGTLDPAGGAIQRSEDGSPSGVLQEAASRLVNRLIPPPTAATYARAIPPFCRELIRLGVVAVHDPGGLVADPELRGAYAAYARLADARELPLRVHACLRQEGLTTARERGLRSGDPLGGGPDGWARVGWQKLFADGTLGSRTAALLAPIEPEPGRTAPTGRERGIFITPPEALRELAAAAAEAGIVSQIHAIGDAAVRAALDALEPHAGRHPLMPRVEHVQLVDPADLGRFAAGGVAASVQPVHLRSDAAQARLLWGERAERSGYPWASLVGSGAVVPFGTDAPVEPIDPWPGLAVAVTRADPSWPEGAAPFGPGQAIGLDRALRAACVDPARSAGEADRGRLVAGQRADLAIVPGAALEAADQVGGPLGSVQPRAVFVAGEVAFEA